MQMSKNSQWSTQCQPNTGTIAVWENTRQRRKVKQLSPRRQHHIQPALNQGLRECGQKPQRNISRGTWRVEDYCSFMAITATNGETGHSFLWRSGTKLKPFWSWVLSQTHKYQVQALTFLEWSFLSPCLRTLDASSLSPSPGGWLQVFN